MRAPVICTGFNLQFGSEKQEVTTLSLRREKRGGYDFRVDREMKKVTSFCVCDETQKLLRNKIKIIRYSRRRRACREVFS